MYPSKTKYIVLLNLLVYKWCQCVQRQEYAIAVTLSDESHYTIYRSLEVIAKFQVDLKLLILMHCTVTTVSLEEASKTVSN